jgi:hypothetical protein
MKSATSILNGNNVKLNDHGTFTAYFGPRTCGDISDCLDVSDGWSFPMRIYRLRPSVLDGSYTLPEVRAAR